MFFGVTNTFFNECEVETGYYNCEIQNIQFSLLIYFWLSCSVSNYFSRAARLTRKYSLVATISFACNLAALYLKKVRLEKTL